MYEVGARLVAQVNGVDFGQRGGRYTYGAGWIGTLREGDIIEFDNGQSIHGCDPYNFRNYIEDMHPAKQWGERTR